MNKSVDVVIIGAGAAGLMCAITAGNRDRSVLVLDHANKVGKKILMSGGGKCNFTNQIVEAEHFLSHNRHFCKSALARYSQWNFIALVEKYNIPYHEKTLGQLFCNNKSTDILNMLLNECKRAKVTIKPQTKVLKISKITSESAANQFCVETVSTKINTTSVVIATGGLSIPTMGATDFGWRIAQQFGLNIYPPTAGLVPLIFNQRQQKRFSELSGTAVDIRASCNGQSFKEAMLFTHKGLSGPAILQISSYWKPGIAMEIDLLPGLDAKHWLLQRQQQRPDAALKTVLAELFTKKLSEKICEHVLSEQITSFSMKQLSEKHLKQISEQLSKWIVYPEQTAGYRTAEVTLGGVDTDELSSKTFETIKHPGLYFIGEVLDVTGHLGGYNFQWAWSSGFAAGSFV